MHSSCPAAAAHAAKATSVHAAAEATSAVHAATAEATPAVTTTAAEAAATARESRRCESKRRGDHTSNQAIKGSVVHPIFHW